MKKNHVFTLAAMLIVMVSASVWANPVSPEQARQVASGFLSGKTVVDRVTGKRVPRRAPAQNEMETKVVFDATDSLGQPLMYAVNFKTQGGFVLVSGDDRFNEVLGYSDSEQFDEQNMPDNMRAWLQGYTDEMNYLISVNYQPTPRRAPAAKAAIDYLVKTKWGQSNPFNLLCPMDIDDKRSITGCMATAMAQVLNYHIQHDHAPSALLAEIPAYTTRGHGLEVAAIPAGSMIPDKSLLLDVYDNNATDEQKQAVARLMLYCGAALGMDYTSSASSGTRSLDVPFARYFGCQSNWLRRGRYTYAEWEDMIYSELKAGRPVYYSGANNDGGHAFVVDGYDGEGWFHVNWGWSGGCDGYYVLTSMAARDGGQDGNTIVVGGWSGDQQVFTCEYTGEAEEPVYPVRLSLSVNQVDGQVVKCSAWNRTGAVRSFDLGIGFLDDSGEITPITYWTANDLCINCGWGSLDFTVPTNTDNARLTKKVVTISRVNGTEQWLTGTDAEISFIYADYDENGVPHLRIPGAELHCNSITIPTQKYVHEQQTVLVSITNNGDEYYRDLHIFASLTEEKGSYLDRMRATILTNETLTFNFSWTPTEAGIYTVWITKDINGEDVLASTTVTIQADASTAGKTLAITDILYNGLDKKSLQLNEVTGVREYNIYTDYLSGSVTITNVSESPVTAALRILYDEYDEQSGEYIRDTYTGTYGSATFAAGDKFNRSTSRTLTFGKTYRIRLYDPDSDTDLDDRYIIHLLPEPSGADKLYTSALADGTGSTAHWSFTPNPTTPGTTVDVTHFGNRKVRSIAPQQSGTWEWSYSGTIQSFTAPATGVYEVHAWGAQGGKCGKAGGLGGYASCRTNLTAGETIYIYVGGRGGAESKTGGVGGWNGGGKGGSGYGQYNGSAGGGGATHISKVNNQIIGSGSGQCASLAGTDFILVAGGGGGASHQRTTPGAGGGTEGGLGTRYTGSNDEEYTYSDQFYYSTSQSFGADGGNGYTGGWSAEGAGGGGGGYYGGTSFAPYGTFSGAQLEDASGCGGNSACNSSLASDFSTTAGQREGNGKVEIRLISTTVEPTPISTTKIADNHWQYTMPASNVSVQVEYVTEYASITSAPTAINGLTYNGEAQALIQAGEAEGGTLYYSLDTYNWSTTVPVAISGSHTVYYKVVADADHLDYIPSPNTISVAIADFDGSGTADAPYLIPSELAWNHFVNKVNSGTSYEGKHFRQTADINVTTMAGTKVYPFKGIYDGAGYTLTVAYNTTEECTAPFRYIEGATIKNLRTAGTITTSAKFAGSIVGQAKCNNTILNCRAGVAITSTKNGDGTHGGVIGLMQGDNTNNTITAIEGTVFEGKLLGDNTNSCGGFVGWCPTEQQVRLELANNLFAPQEVTLSTASCKTFSRGSDMNLITITNCYYSRTLGSVQGKQMYSITGEDGVSVANAGAATEYSVSGITSYGTGIVYDGVLYGGSGDAISLNLSGSTNYTTSAGTITGSSNPHILTMAAANTVIYGDATVTAAPSAKNLTYNGVEQALVNAGTASGGTMNYSLDNSSWSTSIPTATDADTYTVYYKVIGDANHTDYTPSPNTVAVTISKAASVLTSSPSAIEGLVYTGAAQTLISAGSATGGELQYKLDDGAYGTSLPQATDADTYTVYYKVIGDANHNDVDEASISVTIAAASASTELKDDEDNTALLSSLNDGNAHDITINRSLSRDGYYNTLCLPFDLDAVAISGGPLEGFVICELTAISVSGDMLYLEMDITEGIEAGKPYLVRYAGAPTTAISPLVFNDVTVAASAGSNQAVTGAVMHGILEPTVLEQNNENVLFLAPGNTLKWNGTGSALRGFRAYFSVTGSQSLAPVHRGMPARIIEYHNTPTDIETVTGNPSPVTRKELRNGQLIIIRGWKEYNAQGQTVK